MDPFAVDSQEMTLALLRAGASSIVVSEVHHFSDADEQVIRGQRKTIDFPDRLRFEVAAPHPGWMRSWPNCRTTLPATMATKLG